MANVIDDCNMGKDINIMMLNELKIGKKRRQVESIGGTAAG